MFSILLHPLAAKSLSRMEGEIGKRIKKKLKELAEFPEQRGKHLRYTSSASLQQHNQRCRDVSCHIAMLETRFWSLRIGDYRAIYEINKNGKRVVVLFIGHRDNVYDDFSKLF